MTICFCSKQKELNTCISLLKHSLNVRYKEMILFSDSRSSELLPYFLLMTLFLFKIIFLHTFLHNIYEIQIVHFLILQYILCILHSLSDEQDPRIIGKQS